MLFSDCFLLFPSDWQKANPTENGNFAVYSPLTPKLMTPQTWAVVIVAVILLFVFLYRIKRKKEKKMGKDLETLVEKKDWRGVCRIFKKQMIIWGAVLAASIALLIVRIVTERHFTGTIILAAFFAYRFFKLVKLYRISLHNAQMEEANADEEGLSESDKRKIEDFLDCNFTYVADPHCDVKQLWLEARERGKREGFHPIVLSLNAAMGDVLYINSCGEGNEEDIDINRLREWRMKTLAEPVGDGEEILRKRYEEEVNCQKEDGTLAEWEADVVNGAASDDEAYYGELDTMSPEGRDIMIAEVPVHEPWQVFAYLPVGGWNECPDFKEHMAVAKYWYEKYGATIAGISNDTVEYVLPHPVSETEAKELAKEQFAYCTDNIYQGFDNLATRALASTKATVWYFWWD